MTKSYKTTLAVSAIAAIVIMVVAVAPLATSVDARKTVTPEQCIGDPQDRPECPGNSAEGNPHRTQQECSVTGGGGEPVRGQEKKICD